MALAIAVLPPHLIAQISTTTVQGTVYRADGTPARGTLLVTWPAFTTPQNQAVAAGTVSSAIGADGFVSLNLAPNASALPMGSYYTAVYHLNDGTVNQEYWVVPASANASIATVRAQLEPSTVAVQPISKAYLDSAISSLNGSWLSLGGGTMTGPLNLDTDPASANQAATKHYADQLAQAQLPLAGGTVTGPLNAKQFEGRLYADQWQSGSSSNNGIAMSLSQCVSLPYACQVLAPALYNSTEVPAWSRINAAQFGIQQSSLATSQVTHLLDERNGGSFETVLNPYAATYPGSSNPYVGSQLKVDFTALPSVTPSPWQGYVGHQSTVTQTQGGVLSQIYDFTHQSTLVNQKLLTIRNTSAATESLEHLIYCTAPGDCVAQQTEVFGPAGVDHPWDEGMELWSNVVSSTINVYRGTLTGSPTAGATALQVSAPGRSGEQIPGSQGENRWLIDTQAGKFTSLTASAIADDVQPFSDPSANCQGISCNSFTQITSTTTVPASSAWGSLTSAITVPANALVPGNETISVSMARGSLTPGLACLADEAGTPTKGTGRHLGNYETINIAATGSGTFTATMHKSHPSGGTIWQGGLCGEFAEIVGSDLPSGSAWSNGESGGTTAYPVRFVWPVLGSVDGSHLILWTGRNEWYHLDTAWSYQSNKTINLYQGAEVYKIVGANNDTTDNHFALAPNAAPWAGGDTVEEPQFPNQEARVGDLSTSQWLPHNGGPKFTIQFLGRTENQDTGIMVNNSAPWSRYTGGGGSWIIPQAAYQMEGPWSFGLLLNSSNVASALGLPCGTNCGSLQRIVNPGFAPTSDYFGYTNTSGNTGSGGTWSFTGNLSVAGPFHGQGSITGAAINGEITVDGTTYTSLNAAWTAAVSQANSSGSNQTIRLGPGTFSVTATLAEPTNGSCVSLIGSAAPTVTADNANASTVITVPSGLGGDLFSLQNASGTQAQSCTFRDLMILANKNANHAFNFQWFRGLYVDDLTVNDTTQDAFYLGETSGTHQANREMRDVTVSYSSSAFTPANRPNYGLNLQNTVLDSFVQNLMVRNALQAAVYNSGSGTTFELIHGFGYPYSCTAAPCKNTETNSSAADASWATNYEVVDNGSGGNMYFNTYMDSPAVAAFDLKTNGVQVNGGHIQWPDTTSFPNATFAEIESTLSSNLVISNVDCLNMSNTAGIPGSPAGATGVWISYMGTNGSAPSYSSVSNLAGCGQYVQQRVAARQTAFDMAGNNSSNANYGTGQTGMTPKVFVTPLSGQANEGGVEVENFSGGLGDSFFSGLSGQASNFAVMADGTVRHTGLQTSAVFATSSTTLTKANHIVLANATTGALTLTLPSCYSVMPDGLTPTGMELTIIKTDATGNAVQLTTTSSETISVLGSKTASYSLTAMGGVTVACGPDSNWYSTEQIGGTATSLASTPSQCPAGSYATGIAANGSANCAQAWRSTWYGNFGGTFGTSANSSLGAIWSPSTAVSITRLDIAVGTAPAGCSTWPVVGIYDGTASAWLKSVTLAAGTYSYRNAVTGVAIAAGHNLSMGVQTAGVGCTTNPASAQLTMEYAMNQ
jgi:hypothetical protein